MKSSSAKIRGFLASLFYGRQPYRTYAAAIAVTATGAALIIRAQNLSTDSSTTAAPAVLPPDALNAIMNPATVDAQLDTTRPPEELLKKAYIKWTLENPGDYYQRVLSKDPVYLAQKPGADFTLLNPVDATAARLSQPDQKFEAERVAKAFENAGH